MRGYDDGEGGVVEGRDKLRGSVVPGKTLVNQYKQDRLKDSEDYMRLKNMEIAIEELAKAKSLNSKSLPSKIIKPYPPCNSDNESIYNESNSKINCLNCNIDNVDYSLINLKNQNNQQKRLVYSDPNDIDYINSNLRFEDLIN